MIGFTIYSVVLFCLGAILGAFLHAKINPLREAVENEVKELKDAISKTRNDQ